MVPHHQSGNLNHSFVHLCHACSQYDLPAEEKYGVKNLFQVRAVPHFSLSLPGSALVTGSGRCSTAWALTGVSSALLAYPIGCGPQ